MYKKILILFLSIFLIFVISIFAINKSQDFKKKVKLYLPFDLITFLKVVTNFDGNLFSHYENDYKVKFLPETAFVTVNFKKYKLDFIRRGNLGNFPFLVDTHKENLFLTDTSGKIYFSEIDYLINGNMTKFKKIETNLSDTLPLVENKAVILENYRDSDKNIVSGLIDKPDILIVNDKIYYATGFIKNKCHQIELYSGDISTEKINFNLIFSTKAKFNQCLHPNNNFGRIAHYFDGTDNNILLSIGHSAEDNDDTFGNMILINEEKNYSEVIAKGLRGTLGIYADENVILGTDNGPKGGDEINKIEKGNHYGYPYVSYGEKYTNPNYSKPTYKKNHKKYGYTEPIYSFVYALGIAEIIKIPNTFSDFWQDNFLISTLNGRHLLRVKFGEDYNKLLYNEKIYIGERVRDLKYLDKSEKIILSLTSTGSIGIISKN